MKCLHCDKEIKCDCGRVENPSGVGVGHHLDCELRLFLAGNSHNGAGARKEYE